MNQELAEFFIQFTAKGFDEVKKDLDDLSKKMDEVGTASDKAAGKHKGFFDSITGWVASLGTLTGAVALLRTAWNNVADAAASTMTIYNQAMLAGTDPQTLERWQNVARHKQLNANEIFSDFRSGQALLKQFEYAEISDEFNKVFGQAGLSADAIIESVKKGNLDDTFRMLNREMSKKNPDGKSFALDSGDVDRVMHLLGFGDTMISLLRLENLPELLQNANLIYTKDPELLEASARRTEARESLRDSWKEIWANSDFMNAQTSIMNSLQTLIPHVKKIADWCAEKTAKAVETVADMVNDTTPSETVKKPGGKRKVVNEGVGWGLTGGIAGALAGAKAGVWFGGLPGIIGGALLGALVGGMIADKNWGDETLIEKDAKDSDLQQLLDKRVEQIKELMGYPDAGGDATAASVSPLIDNSATAIINIDGVRRVERTSHGKTIIDLSVDDLIPSSAR